MPTGQAYLDVEEVLDVEGDGGSVDGRVVVQVAIVGEVCPHGERHRLRLRSGGTHGVSTIIQTRQQSISGA